MTNAHQLHSPFTRHISIAGASAAPATTTSTSTIARFSGQKRRHMEAHYTPLRGGLLNA